ncbi:sensor histidine kinase [Rheinheimera riviphila]|uniref:sensor histidine kinase n=1 Tax=Rheinheimera riviphila TaxID=1834037 RepID=UPI0013E36927|nr:ATP-binding protein [Rheinheimera riviphila]
MSEKSRLPHWWWRAVSGYLLWMLLLAIFGQHWVFARQQQQSAAQAERLAAFIRYEIGRYADVAATIAKSEPLVALVQQADFPALNRYLYDLQQASQSADVYLLDPAGLVLASSNYQSDSSYVGRDFGFRPYVQAAVKGENGQYYALGHTSGRRGYYYSAPVYQQQRLIAIIALKIDLEPIEQQQQAIAGLNGWHFLVTGQSQEVFLSDKPDWRFKTLQQQHLSAAEKERYLTQPLSPLGQQQQAALLAPAYGLWQMPVASSHQSFLPFSLELPEFGWQLVLLQRPQNAPLGWLLLFGTLCYLGSALGWLWLRERRKRRLQLLQHNQALEQRVLARTAELADTNQRLVLQISRREQTESALAQTEQELVQAAKLATIGSLSASLNHELNQPLTALQSYTQNTQRMLEKSMVTEATANLGAMLKLIQRLSNIIAQFKDFSRPGSGKNQPVELQKTLLDALGIVQHQCQRQGVKTRLKQPEQPLWVLVDPIQLEQVLVNILTNGLHAMLQTPEPGFSIVLESDQQQALIRIRDNGPGIEPHHLERIFEAFFTTKQRDGLGLGLSISQRIMQSFGGSLQVANHPPQGAEFTIRLPLHSPLQAPLPAPLQQPEPYAGASDA